MASGLPELHCHRCIYTWTPRRPVVRMCPRCKSRKWSILIVRPLRLGSGLGPEEVIGRNRAKLLRVLRKHGASKVRVFGSVRRREATEQSDLDLLVDRLAPISVLGVAKLRVELRELLGRRVDVVEEQDLHWAMRPQVLAEALPV